jgi:queuine tRNA-ribosyltransferase
VIATRHARSGMFYTWKGRMRMTDRRYRNDYYPPDTRCDCYVCTTHTRAYLNHLFRIDDILGAVLATVHNLHWYARFMQGMRDSIVNGTFAEFRKDVHENYAVDTRPAPVAADQTERSQGLERQGRSGSRRGRGQKGSRGRR